MTAPTIDDFRTLPWKYLFTGFDGRIGRKPFWLGLIVLCAGNLALSLLFGLIALAIPPAIHLSYLASAAMLFSVLALSAKRWHDLDRSEWWALLVLLPLLGLLCLVVPLGVVAGQAGDNRFGRAPGHRD